MSKKEFMKLLREKEEGSPCRLPIGEGDEVSQKEEDGIEGWDVLCLLLLLLLLFLLLLLLGSLGLGLRRLVLLDQVSNLQNNFRDKYFPEKLYSFFP